MKILSLMVMLITAITAIAQKGLTTNQKPDRLKTVVVWEVSNPENLNPFTSTGASATYIKQNIFSRLLAYDNKTLEIIPQTAIARPEIKEIEEGEYKGGMSLTYEIRTEAKWDNGDPVTAKDYIFSIKALKNPKVNAAPLRPYLQFIHDIKIDEKNPKKFTIYSKERYFQAESSSGNYYIIPEYIYDPNQIMRQFSLPELNDSKKLDKLRDDPKINEFAEAFNSFKFERETVIGSGPYTMKSWEDNDEVILVRKKDWWGDKVENVPALKAYPPKIVHKVISDSRIAIEAVKEEQIDVMRSIHPKVFNELQEDEEVLKNYNLYTPNMLAYAYIGMNTNDPRLADKRVRRALAHLNNAEQIINELYSGFATPTAGPIYVGKPYYDNKLKPIQFSIEKAKELLAEAGWKDKDGDGILDKKIKGKTYKMEFTFRFNQGNEIRKKIGLLFKDNAKKVGIKIEVIAQEWTVFLEKVKNHDFELMCLSWIQGPGLDDMKQIWHTESISASGSNYVGFGDAKSDKIIDEIRTTLDPDRREELYKEIQKIIYDEQPYIFLFNPQERIAIHKRFDVQPSALRPGYRANLFKLKKK